jgi:hypothetical protein
MKGEGKRTINMGKRWLQEGMGSVRNKRKSQQKIKIIYFSHRSIKIVKKKVILISVCKSLVLPHKNF